jgi:hypothetical protein
MADLQKAIYRRLRYAMASSLTNTPRIIPRGARATKIIHNTCTSEQVASRLHFVYFQAES